MRKKVDANQQEIVQALRKMGASVLHLHELGKGAPDILIGHRGKNYLAEIKDNGNLLTIDQVDWHEAWRGQVVIIQSVGEAIAFLETR